MKVLVLAGGDSAEREVSLDSGKEVADALRRIGHTVTVLDAGVGRERLAMFATGKLSGASHDPGAEAGSSRGPAIREGGIDVSLRDYHCVFIALHGGSGENGTLQAVLDLANVRYTGSGMFASAVAMDKYRSKIIFDAVGIPVPALRFFGTTTEAAVFAVDKAALSLQYPLVVKPNTQGSTIGLSIVPDSSGLATAVKTASEYDSEILIEDYIAGREMTVAVLDDKALPVLEIIPNSGLYDYRAKYTSGESRYVCPAEISQSVESAARKYALRAFKVLGCRGYARVDFRLSNDNKLYCLELNTLPGMTATSLVPKAAKAVGMSFEELLQRIVELALDNSDPKVDNR